MKYWAWLAAGTILAAGAPALAGQEVLYLPAPDWVVRAELPEDRSGPPVLLYDDQQRIEEGRLTAFTDRAIRIDNPQMLNAAGTLQAAWIPDKGDLRIHEITILRGGEEIDVLAQGASFDVLRRERMLERRMIDGVLTATLAVPGLRVGDVLRLSHSTTTSDQALDKEVQALAALPSAPFEAKLARVRMSWPTASDVAWRVSEGVTAEPVDAGGGFTAVEIALPLPERPPMPDDAPVRYRMPPLLQAGTFADWSEISRVMAPHYATEGAIAASAGIAGEVRRIEAAHSAPLERAVAALRLVQDEVAYLANGMDGGNYLPQSPAETWDNRYGDCKAKTLLLLAMLREMGIEAEPTLVASATGDAVPTLLPMPMAFDHVIVRAVIDGTEYWLDGTDSGASMAVAANVPAFHYALPLRDVGANLLPMAQRPKQAFDTVSQLTFDHRAGLDVPLLYDARWTVTGTAAGQIRAIIGQGSEEQVTDFLRGFAAERLGPGQLVESDIAYDEGSNSATISASGVLESPWGWERGRGRREFSLPTSGFAFRPDRTRSAWRGIPVAIPGPYSERTEMTVLLPEGGGAYAIEGNDGFEQELASVQLNRATRLERGRLVVSDSIAWPGGELPAEQAAAERTRAARFSTDLRLVAPAGTARRHDAAAGQGRARFKPLEDAYAALVAREPDRVQSYRSRAAFRNLIYDREGALADYGRVIELEPAADIYLQRSYLLVELGRMEDALAEARMADDIYPSIQTAMAQANAMQYLGQLDEAIMLLEDQGGTAEERRTLVMQLSELEAHAGRKDEGLQLIDDMLESRPGDPQMLNARCWYKATWNFATEDMLETCTEAVERADWSAPALDSRAMGYYRIGRLDDALHDLEAALAASPDLTPSLFMRGIVRRELGQAGAEADIAQALARQPSLEHYFARFGIMR